MPLSKQAQADPTFNAYIADSGQPGLYAWVRRGGIRFVFAYRPPAGGARVRMKIDEYPGIPLEEARNVASSCGSRWRTGSTRGSPRRRTSGWR